MANLPIPGTGRAEALQAALDERFLAFVAALPDPLRGYALRRSTYTGEPGEGAFGGPSTMNPGVTLTPWLFWELTSPLEDVAFLELAEGGCMVVVASALLDHLVDGQSSPQDAALLQRLLHERGIAALRACLGGGSSFWPIAERLIAEHLGGLAAERRMRSEPREFEYADFEGMVKAKFSPIVLTMAGYLAATGREDLLEPIESSVKNLAVASQLLDDLGDWEQDLLAGRLTYFLSRAMALRSEPFADVPKGEEVRETIRSTWLDIDHLNLADEWLSKAVAAVEGIPCPKWIDYLAGFRDLTRQHIRQATAGHLLHALEPLFARGVAPDLGDPKAGEAG